jgi:hypothetical protein
VGHSQVKAFTPSEHVPPFWHGFGKQSSMLFSQFVPSNPVAHAQV